MSELLTILTKILLTGVRLYRKYIAVYKFFTMLLSLIKVDLVMNFFFGATMVYFTYIGTPITPFIIMDILFFIGIISVNIYAIYSIIMRNEKGFWYFSLIRIQIELFKVFKAILIMNNINANYQFS